MVIIHWSTVISHHFLPSHPSLGLCLLFIIMDPVPSASSGTFSASFQLVCTFPQVLHPINKDKTQFSIYNKNEQTQNTNKTSKTQLFNFRVPSSHRSPPLSSQPDSKEKPAFILFPFHPFLPLTASDTFTHSCMGYIKSSVTS